MSRQHVSRRSQFLLSTSLLITILSFTPTPAFAHRDFKHGATETSAEQKCTPQGHPDSQPKCDDSVDDKVPSTITLPQTTDDRGSPSTKWMIFIIFLVVIALAIYSVCQRIVRELHKPTGRSNLTQPLTRSRRIPTEVGSSRPVPLVRQTQTKPPQAKVVEAKGAVQSKPTQPLVDNPIETGSQATATSAKQERPVLKTVTTSSTFDAQSQSETVDESSVEFDERTIVNPPQIGEKSSFARYGWWDKDRDWCQVPPFGMSNDVVCDVGTFGTVALSAVSLRGHKHKVSGEPCQDAFSLRTVRALSGQDFVIAVLCDGMSSAKHSEYGARRTSQLLASSLALLVENEEEVTKHILSTNLPKIFEYCRKNLLPQKDNQYGAPGISYKEVVESDFFTTITFLIIPASSTEDEFIEAIVGSIGDSAIFRLEGSSSRWEQLTLIDDSSEILNPATSAFPATTSANVSAVNLKKSDLVIATSDGVGNFINVRGNQTSLGTYLAKQWQTPVNLPTFVNDVGFDLKSADDDRTVVAIWLSRG